MSGLWWMIAVFLGLFVLRLPAFVVLLGSASVGLMFAPIPIAYGTMPATMWQGVNQFLLLAIPFFTLMGDLSLSAGVSRRLVDAVHAFVGHIRGGLAHVSVSVNMVMAGMSGSDLADAAATGRILIPAMRNAGYPAGYAASLIGGAAMIGPLIPPSIAFLLFSSSTNVSVGRLFLAGAVPGVLLGLALMVQAYFTARWKGFPVKPRLPFRTRAVVTARSIPVLLIPFVVLGSFFAGIATPTESAVLGVLAVVVCGMFYRELTPAAIGEQLLSTARMVGSIFMIIASAAVFARVLTLYGAAQNLTDWITGFTSNPAVFLIMINVVYLLIGCLIDSVPVLLVVVPLIMPTVLKLGIDPVQFGVITVFNLLIGLIMPPYGLTMLLLCKMTNISIQEFWRHMWPIFLTMLLGLAAVTAVPGISLWLPNLLMPHP